jgi:hypothetical protein
MSLLLGFVSPKAGWLSRRKIITPSRLFNGAEARRR